MYKFNIILWTSLFACAVCNCLLIEVLGKDKKKVENSDKVRGGGIIFWTRMFFDQSFLQFFSQTHNFFSELTFFQT